MYIKSIIRQVAVISVPLVLLTAMLMGCTTSESEVVESEDDIYYITFSVADDNDGFTRGAYETAKEFKTYAINSFARNRPYLSNIVMTKQTDGTWKSSRTVTFPGKNAVDFVALMPGFQRSDVQELTMTNDEKSFVHTLPNTNAKQSDFMFSSMLQIVNEGKNTNLLFKFKHMFSYLRFLGKCSVEGLNVKVRSITLHNLKSTGKFTFSNTKPREGSWELRDDLDNYTFLLPEEKDLTSKNATLHKTDSLMFVMSQAPSIFEISDNTSFADADNNGEAYLEVECRVWKMADDGVTPQYIGCSETTWAKVYYPLRAGTAWTSKSIPYSGTYNVLLDYTGGYTHEGEDFLKKHTNGAMTMISVEPIQSFLVTNPWEDDDYNSQTLEMK